MNTDTNTTRKYTTKNLSRVLGRKELFGIAAGQIIGAGIMSMTGIAIGMTGRSVSIGFLLASLLTIIITLPLIFVGSVFRMRGGMYTQAQIFLGPKFAGAFIPVFIIQNITVAVYALSFADYMLSLLPGINKTLIAVLFLTTFFVTNLFGIKGAAKIQNFMVVILALALSLFTAFGIFEIQPGFFSQPGFFTGGWSGFLNATALLTFAVGGSFVVINFGAEAKNPTKDIPFAIIADYSS